MGDAPAALHVRVGRRRSLPPHLTDIVLWRTVSWNWRPSQRAGVYCPVGDEKDEVKMPRTGRDVRGRNVIVAGALGLGTAAIIGGAHVAPLERVYPVAEVTWGLRHHPQAWRGRTILVRGLDIDRQLALALRCPPSIIAINACPRFGYVNFFAPLDPSTFHFVYTTRRNTTRVTVTYPDNYLRLRVGSQQASSATSLPATLYAIPLIGTLFDQRFPRNGNVVLRIRLSSTHTCVRPLGATYSGPCVDGIVQG